MGKKIVVAAPVTTPDGIITAVPVAQHGIADHPFSSRTSLPLNKNAILPFEESSQQQPPAGVAIDSF
jgi:hypothetical protein